MNSEEYARLRLGHFYISCLLTVLFIGVIAFGSHIFFGKINSIGLTLMIMTAMGGFIICTELYSTAMKWYEKSVHENSQNNEDTRAEVLVNVNFLKKIAESIPDLETKQMLMMLDAGKEKISARIIGHPSPGNISIDLGAPFDTMFIIPAEQATLVK